MSSRRRSVFERLGPPADAPPAAAEEPLDDAPPPGFGPSPGFGPPPKQRVALAHPLVARHLTRVQTHQRGAADGSQPASQEQAVEQQRRQQHRQRRQQQQELEQQQGSSAGECEAWHQRKQPDRSRGGQGGAQQELQRLKAERDAAEEMLGQMAAQTQSLLADKAALQQQAAKLEALACALQERLDFLLLEDDSQEWYGEGLLPDAAPESEQGGSYGSSAAQPSTPSATYAAHDVVAAALHGRLDGLAAERQQELHAAAAVGTPSSSGTSGGPSSSGSPEQAAPAADVSGTEL